MCSGRTHEGFIQRAYTRAGAGSGRSRIQAALRTGMLRPLSQNLLPPTQTQQSLPRQT
jgi:hypothetical protein